MGWVDEHLQIHEVAPQKGLEWMSWRLFGTGSWSWTELFPWRTGAGVSRMFPREASQSWVVQWEGS